MNKMEDEAEKYLTSKGINSGDYVQDGTKLTDILVEFSQQQVKKSVDSGDDKISLIAKKIQGYREEAWKQAELAKKRGHVSTQMTSDAMAFAYRLCAELLEN